MHFNPRSLTGATSVYRKAVQRPRRFQSTLPHGSDKGPLRYKHAVVLISIHAPSRERRSGGCARRGQRTFQSTLPHGSDEELKMTFEKYNAFQSTLPHGSDRKHGLLHNIVYEFQSTLPHGSDKRKTFCIALFTYFNPRSLTGATYHKKQIITSNKISIHAPSRERPVNLPAG